MEMDVEALCQAAYGERSAERINSRNGYRDRALKHGQAGQSEHSQGASLERWSEFEIRSSWVLSIKSY